MHRVLIVLVVSSVSLWVGCEKQPEQPVGGNTPAPGRLSKEAAPTADSAPATGHGHGPAVIELGELEVEGMKVRAARDGGEIKAGGDVPIDVWVDGGLGDAAAVRFWIGVQDAKGSIKAKAAVEDGHWHTHAEVPDPLPVDSKLWVEIEGKEGRKAVLSFGLKQ